MPTYAAVLTNVGAAKLAAALSSGIPLVLSQVSLGDGGGSTPTPVATQTALVNQVYITTIANKSVSGLNVRVQASIPYTVGGWTVREVGIVDAAGDLFAVANCPDTVKPAPGGSTTQDMVISFTVHVSDPSGLAFTIDPTVALASQAWVEANFLSISNELSEIAALPSPAQANARANLGLGTAAVHSAADFDAAGAAAAAQTAATAAAATALAAAIAGVTTLTAVLQAIYPVGEVCVTNRTGNPASWLGFGTWVAYAQGQALVGYKAGDANFGTLGQTGGEVAHQLTTIEIPPHSHEPHNHTVMDAVGDLESVRDTGGGGSTNHFYRPWAAGGSFPSADTGGNGAHNNLQPYVVLNVWKRTA